MSEGDTRSLRERREFPRHPLRIDVNYRRGDTYLFSRTENLSEIGIFLVSEQPFGPGTRLELAFRMPGGGETVEVSGEVVWVEPPGGRRAPGMGIRFVDLTPRTRERIKALVRTVQYLG